VSMRLVDQFGSQWNAASRASAERIDEAAIEHAASQSCSAQRSTQGRIDALVDVMAILSGCHT